MPQDTNNLAFNLHCTALSNANSSQVRRVQMARSFLIKIGRTGCPNGIATPRDTADWEGGNFHVRCHLPKIDGKRPRPPESGDVAYLWVNESSGGIGLSARATMSEVVSDNGTLHFRPTTLEVLPAIGLINIDSPVGIFARIDKYRLEQIRLLTDDDEKLLLEKCAERASATSIVQKDHRPPAVATSGSHVEGLPSSIISTIYERDPEAKEACIQHYGAVCQVCDFEFVKLYGELGRGFIHVHHIVPLANVRAAHMVDPVRDLRPVCPNCHAMIHRDRHRPLTIEELRAHIAQARRT